MKLKGTDTRVVTHIHTLINQWLGHTVTAIKFHIEILNQRRRGKKRSPIWTDYDVTEFNVKHPIYCIIFTVDLLLNFPLGSAALFFLLFLLFFLFCILAPRPTDCFFLSFVSLIVNRRYFQIPYVSKFFFLLNFNFGK